MKRACILLLVALCSVIFSSKVHAISESLVISQLQLGGNGTGTASQELIEIYNNSEQDVDVTDWCITYATASSVTTGSNVHCLTTASPHDRLLLTAKKSMTIVTNEFTAANPLFVADDTFSATLSGTSGHVYLLDTNDAVIDRVGWGSAVNPEGIATTAPASGKVLSRVFLSQPSTHQDTDDNANDFTKQDIVLPSESGLYEATDECLNSDFPGLQATVPDGYEKDSDGNCAVIAPLINASLLVTELLPNPHASDTNQEFIEIYNPNDYPVSLVGYTFFTGMNYDDEHHFPEDLEISPHQYLVFYNNDISFTLVNTSSRIKLVAPAGNIVSETGGYQEPKEGMSWSLIDGQWQMTEKPTPEAPNELVITVDEDAGASPTTTSSLAPCPAGKFRNPETNRCKNSESTSSLLTPCASDQERNPATNRCRKIGATADTLAPCKVGQERNPETNRCRKISTNTSSLAPCQVGYERNPETNRCRKASVTNSTLGAPAAINPVQLDSRIIALLIFMAGGYGAYEYRTDITNFLNRLRNKRGDPRPPG